MSGEQSARDAYIASVHDMIEAHGWMLQGVFGPKPTDVFTYTVGLTGKELPELWIGTLPFEIGGGILNTIATRLAAGDLTLVNGGEVDIDWQINPRFRGPCNPEVAEVSIAQETHPLSTVAVWQVLWPDKDGLYPTDVGYDPAGTAPQRLLALA